MKRIAIAVSFALLLGGCLLGSAVECDDTDWPEGLTCAGVVAAARDRLVRTAGITKLSAEHGRYCPPDVRCPAIPNVAPIATVYADLADGSLLYVVVYLEEDARLRAEPPRAVEELP
jgi:hypothetical protein